MMKVLLVDPDSQFATDLKHRMPWSELGVHHVETARDGREALVKCRRAPPDLVVTEIELPRINGLELIRTLKLQHAFIRFMILSGSEEFAFARQACSLGVSEYVLKPCGPDKLALIIAQVLKPASSPSIVASPYASAVVQEAVRYLESHLHEPVSLTAVADHVALSPNYLSRLFKRETGKTFTEYATDIKLVIAKEWLVREKLPIYKIAERLGYQDRKYFRELFKRKWGVTPSELREQQAYQAGAQRGKSEGSSLDGPQC